jgi:scyllo-inositol 2-dehydrogenase (NADP+)
MHSVGIIGYGRIGAEHAAWLAHCDNIRATAVADPTPARRDLARKQGLCVLENPSQLLSDPSIDAILISTPTSMHFDQASAALKAGKHVMVEKPITIDLPQAKELIELAASRNRILSVFHNRRWDPDFLTLQSAIASNLFGKIINIESRLGQWASCVGPAAKDYRPNWRNEASFGGGGLFDWGSHFIDQLWHLLFPSRPTRVFAQLRQNVWSADCDDFARICIDFDNNAAALVEINTTTTLPLPRWHIDGTAGSAYSPSSQEFNVHRWAEFDFTPADPNKPPFRLPLAKSGLTESQIWNQFAAAIAGHSLPAVTADSVLLTMQLLDAARQSAQTGSAIPISQ